MSSEALRLADLFELEQDPESLYRQAASLLRTQAARIAELEAKIAEEDARTTRICGLLGASNAERDQLRAERDTLSRWKSTNAPRIEALQGLKDHAQSEAEKGSEAIASLASERNANAILTSEVEALRAEVERLRKPLADERICELWSWSATAEAERTATTQQHAFARAIEAAKELK